MQIQVQPHNVKRDTDKVHTLNKHKWGTSVVDFVIQTLDVKTINLIDKVSGAI